MGVRRESIHLVRHVHRVRQPGHVDRAGGFTLIEILVALLVLMLGIGGAASAQLTAWRTRHDSSLTSQATELASSLADRMRANAVLLRAGASPYSPLYYDAADAGPPPSPVACFGQQACDSQQMAQFDVDEVRAAIHARFPGGRIVVCRDGAAWDAGAGALIWECDEDAQAPLVIKIGWRGKAGDGAADAAADAAFAPQVALAVEVIQ